MDPLTAFGLSASLVQFITFATSLVQKSVEVHDSQSGLLAVLDIEETYTSLLQFNSRLQDYSLSHQIIYADLEVRHDFESLAALAESCKADCTTLIEVVSKLRVQDGPRRRLKSFKAAFQAYRKMDDIKSLEERLSRIASQITLHLCGISK